MTRPRTIVLGILAVFLLASAVRAETPAEKDARMKWWNEARFGLFVTWGLYAVPAGVWEDGRVCRNAYGEWIASDLAIPYSQYARLAGRWSPRRWDPEALVRQAAAAGMRYLVFTTKYHDGFSMFDTKQSDWSVVKATPWGQDAFRGLAEAARKYGLKLMPYYSILDWHHPLYKNRAAINDLAQGPPDLDRYVAFMKAQLTELQKDYGPLAGIWFDGNWDSSWTVERGRDLEAFVRRLIPGALINNRVGPPKDGVRGIVAGDFSTPEEEIPANGLPGRHWESCMTMNETWGYRKDDLKWKTPETLIRMLIDCASKGGNFLLNVGPTADGEIPEPSREALRRFGEWMRVNEISIRGTQAGPFPRPLPWGRVTRKGNILYLHVFDRPADGRLLLPLKNAVPAARILGRPKAAVGLERGAAGLIVVLPEVPLDAAAAVVELVLDGQPVVQGSIEPPSAVGHWLSPILLEPVKRKSK